MLESQLLQVKYEKEAKVCWFLNRFPAHGFGDATRALQSTCNTCNKSTSEHVQLKEMAEI